MVLDNHKFESMSKHYPKTMKFGLNPVYYATRIGIQAYIGVAICGALGLYLCTFNQITFPYLTQPTRKEYLALPDLYSKQVQIYERTVKNQIQHL